MTTAQNVQVKMADGLSAVVSGVDGDAVTVDQTLLLRDLVGRGKQMSEELRVGCGAVRERRDVLLWNDEDVRRGLRMDVGKGEDVVIFVKLSDGNGATRNFAEETIGQIVERRHWSVEKTLSSGFLYTLSSTLCPLLYFLKYFGSTPGAQGS